MTALRINVERDRDGLAKTAAMPVIKLKQAGRRMRAWRRVLDALAELRAALEHRIWREDPSDTLLAADVQTWCELSAALADYQKARTVE